MRVQHRHELEAIIVDWMNRHSRDEVIDILERHSVPVGPVNDPRDIAQSESLRERRSIVTMQTPELGDVVLPGRMFHMSGVPEPDYDRPPSLGEHTNEVLGAAGYSATEIDALRGDGVVA
jgi:formyl-CoA transferase